MQTPASLALAIVYLALLGCGGGPSVKCGEGTKLSGSTCVTAVRCGEGTVLIDDACVLPPKPTFKDALVDLTKFSDAMCACRDEACADKVQKQLDGLSAKYDRLNSVQPTDAEQEQLMELVTKFGQCKMALQIDRTTELHVEYVKQLYDGARAYYMDAMPGGPPQTFPEPSAGPAPPLGECCKQGGTCDPVASLWDTDTWIALQFSVDDPHKYSYKYEVTNAPGKTDGTMRFTVSAYGDLDCDSVYSTFSMTGVIDETYQDGPSGNPRMLRINESE